MGYRGACWWEVVYYVEGHCDREWATPVFHLHVVLEKNKKKTKNMFLNSEKQ